MSTSSNNKIAESDNRNRKRRAEEEQLQQRKEQKRMPESRSSRDSRNLPDLVRNDKQHSSSSSYRHRSPPTRPTTRRVEMMDRRNKIEHGTSKRDENTIIRERRAFKRSRSRTPPIAPSRGREIQRDQPEERRHFGRDQQQHKRRLVEKSPIRRIEQREVKKEQKVIEDKKTLSVEKRTIEKKGFSNSGFGDSGFDRNTQRNQRQDSQGKPRILAPGDTTGEGKEAQNQQQKSTGFNLIVNELTAAAIKREENPLKSARGTRRTFRGADFTYMRRGGRGSKFGVTNARQPVVTREGIRTSRSFDGANSNIDGRRDEGTTIGKFTGRRIIMNANQNNESTGTDSTVTRTLNPFAVPRGRNYFLHDHRDAFADSNRLYDPRLDRGSPRGRGGGGRFLRGGRAGGFEGRGGGLTTARGGSGSVAPLGWRNFESKEGNEQSNAFSRDNFYAHRGAGLANVNGNPSWRSKAEEDLVWKHDKYMEVTQEDTKLELLDEIDGEPLKHEDEPEPVPEVCSKQDDFTAQELYQREEFLYENEEEELVYD